jgi:hypothetical protein
MKRHQSGSEMSGAVSEQTDIADDAEGEADAEDDADAGGKADADAEDDAESGAEAGSAADEDVEQVIPFPPGLKIDPDEDTKPRANYLDDLTAGDPVGNEQVRITRGWWKDRVRTTKVPKRGHKQPPCNYVVFVSFSFVVIIYIVHLLMH